MGGRRRRVLGEDHPATLSSLSNPGVLLQDAEKLDEAEPYLREALERRPNVLGPEYADTLITSLTLRTLYRTRGDDTEAIALLMPIEERARAAFTGGNPHRLASILMNLGMARAGRGFEPARYAAEANLIEAHGILVADPRRDVWDDPRVRAALIDLYAVRDAAEPCEGHGEKGAAWRARLEVSGNGP